MKIGLDASRANKIEKTGVEWYSYHLIQELKKIADPADRFVLYSREHLRGGLEDLPLNFTSKVLTWPPKRLWTHLRLSWEMLVNPPDVLFVPASAIPLIHPKKTITACHDVGFERFPGAYSAKERRYHKWSVRFALKHADRIITISEFTKKELVEIYGAESEKIAVVYLGYDREIYKSIANMEKIKEVLNKYKINGPYILFVGRLEEKKNVLGLIEAFQKLKTQNAKCKTTTQNSKLAEFEDLKLFLVGKPGFGGEKILKTIREHNLEDSVILPDWVREEDLPYLYNGAEMFVFPSFYEGFGIPILEAMACGTPVVASKAASLPEVAGGAALLVNPASPEEIAGAIKELLENRELREDLKKKGLERVKNFSWAKCTEETLKVLKS